MTEQEFQKIRAEESDARFLFAWELLNQTDRTLLYGYDCDRNTYHLYLQAGHFVRHWYKRSETLRQLTDDVETLLANRVDALPLDDPEAFVPNKRLYPEACDFEFCALLKDRGVHMSFTSWDNERAAARAFAMARTRRANFHGELAEEPSAGDPRSALPKR